MRREEQGSCTRSWFLTAAGEFVCDSQTQRGWQEFSGSLAGTPVSEAGGQGRVGTRGTTVHEQVRGLEEGA